MLSGYRSQFFTWELNFWYEGTLGHDQKKIYFSFQKFLFFRFLGPFFVFPYIFFVFAIDHNIGPRNLNLGMYAHCDIEKAKKKFFSEILKIDVFRAIFRFSYIFFVFACYQATGHNFLHMNLNFGMRRPQDTCNDYLFQFFKIFIFFALRTIFSFFSIYSLFLSQITLLDLRT